MWDKGKRANGTLSRADFRFEPDRDLYICPRGNVLTTTGKVHDGRTLLYQASKHDCDPCPLKLRCRPKEPARKIPRDVNEAARDLARCLMQTEGYHVSARQRKMIEAGFGDMIRNLGLTRLRLRGLTGANESSLVLRPRVKAIRRPWPRWRSWSSPEPTTSPTTATARGHERGLASPRRSLTRPPKALHETPVDSRDPGPVAPDFLTASASGSSLTKDSLCAGPVVGWRHAQGN